VLQFKKPMKMIYSMVNGYQFARFAVMV